MPLKNISLFIAAALLLAVISGYVILIRSKVAALLVIEDLEESIAAVGTREDKKAEERVLGYEKKIKEFVDLSVNSSKNSQFFDNLEKLVHPQVWFSSFELDAVRYRAAVSGKTASFQTLEQQLIFFRNRNDSIESVDLTSIALGEEGGAEFSFNLIFKPEIFGVIKKQ